MCRCPNMAVKEAEENDMTDDDADADTSSVCNGTTEKRSKLSVESATGRPQHKCGRKPTVSCTQHSWNPLDAHCCHMGSAIKHPVPDRVKPSVICNFLHLGTLDAQT